MSTAERVPILPDGQDKRKFSHRLRSLPTEDDLPYQDNQVMESDEHRFQMELLAEPLILDAAFQEWYISCDMMVHFTLDDQVKKVQKKFRGPDVFVVKNAERRLRKSWVVWAEGKPPDVIIELLSRSTIRTDEGIKKELYSKHLKTPEYYLYHVRKKSIRGFTLQNGNYEVVEPDRDGSLFSAELGLKLVRWTGRYMSMQSTWLRWSRPDGALLLTGEEIAHQEKLLKEREQQLRVQEQQLRIQEQRRAEEAEERAARMAALLRSLGVDPES